MTTTLPLEVQPQPPLSTPVWHAFIAPGIYAASCICLFHTVLFGGAQRLFSNGSADLTLQFLPWRDFGFSQLRHGHIPLWNPYIYGGAPYFAGFQSALLYPPNWLHLILPLTVAINWIIGLHIFLAGYFTYLWARARGGSIAGAFVAGMMFMFSGAYYLHMYAGHLPHLCLMPWVPLVWITIEKLSATGRVWWLFCGIPAMCMVILAGHPQYVYYTGIVTGLYTLMLMLNSKHRLAVGGGFVAIMVGASLIVAVQLLTGAEAAGESVRSGGTQYEFASMFALPPENLVTFVAPGFFGNLPLAGDAPEAVSYFGRCYLWEMSVYVSVAGFCLAMYAGMTNWRKNLIVMILVLVTVLLALGKHLPIYDFLYHYLPAYSSFRCVAKFTFFTTLLICVMAADGLDLLLATRERYTTLWATVGLIGAGAVLLFSQGLLAKTSAVAGEDGTWGRWLHMINASRESYFIARDLQDPKFYTASAAVAFSSAAWGASTLALVAALFIASRFNREAAYGLLALAAIEMGSFAVHNRAFMEVKNNYPVAWLNAIRSTPGDFRVVTGSSPEIGGTNYLNQGMSLGIQNLWGYDPGVLKRYAELIAASQGLNPDEANQYTPILRIAPGVFQMLRVRFALIFDQDGPAVAKTASPMPVAWTQSNWVLRIGRDDVLRAVLDDSFNPRQTIVLESQPSILPSASAPTGPAEIVAESTDWVEVKTSTSAPVLLLITNNYSPGWHVTAVEKGPQDEYEIMPANYTQMAIPLAAGSHHLRIEYAPTAFYLGKWISIVSLLAYIGMFGAWIVRRRICAV